MVRGILIPAAEQRDPESRSFESLDDYLAAVGGWIEAVDIPTADVTLFVNEEGIPAGLPFNRRATYFWSHFARHTAGTARLFGDVVLVGSPDSHGESTDAPDEILEAIAPGTRHVVQLRPTGSDAWRSDPSGGQRYFEAIVWATLVAEMAAGAVEARVSRLPRLLP
jgi:hypothetical protein